MVLELCKCIKSYSTHITFAEFRASLRSRVSTKSPPTSVPPPHARLLHVLSGITHASRDASKRDYPSSTSSSAAVRSRLRVRSTAASVLARKPFATAASVLARKPSAEHEATR